MRPCWSRTTGRRPIAPKSSSSAITSAALTDRTATLTLTDGPTVDVAPSFSDDTGDAQGWTVGTAITPVTVPSAGGSPAPTYAAVGSLPAGINFNTATRVISGTPTAVGTGTITVTATNSEGDAAWTVSYTTAAAGVLLAPAFADNTGDAQSWTQNTAIADIAVPTATGTPTPSYSVVGALPAGIAFDTSTRAISGTPTTAGSGTITIRASNSEGTADWTVDYTTTAPPPGNIAPSANAGGNQSVAAGATVVLNGTGSTDVDGTIVSYAWARIAGPAVTLNGANTSIANFAAPTGSALVTFTFRLTVADDDGATNTADVSIFVQAFVPPPSVGPTYTLEVDWDNDGTYANSRADVWPRVRQGTFQCKRGRNFASQRIGLSIAGTLFVELDNRDGLYDPQNPNSALFGLLASGRRIRWRMTDSAGVLKTQWTGWIDELRNIEVLNGLDYVQVRALGVFSRLNGHATVNQQTSILTRNAAQRLFDPDGSIGASAAVVDGVDYLADRFGGDREMARWWAADQSRLKSLRELEGTEGGFLFEAKDGYPAMDAYTRRSSASSRTSLMTLTDETPLAGEIPAVMDGLTPDQPFQDFANRITSILRKFAPGSQQVLWEADGLDVPGNTTAVIVARYPNSPVDNVAVSSWTALAAGTDYTAQSGVAVSMVTQGNEATVTIVNSNGAAITMDLQIRGRPLVQAHPIEIPAQDADSILAYGPSAVYPLPTFWLSSVADVMSLQSFILSIYAEPAERVTGTWEAASDLDQATARDLADRVSVIRRGTEYDYFIESIGHHFSPDGAFHYITDTLSPAGLYGQVIVLDQGPALGVGVLAP